jgi:Fe2+ transport system protein FeoA
MVKADGAETLSQLNPGEHGRVIRIKAKGSVRRRILEMGLTPGSQISVKGVAPLGDPMELLVKGYSLSLRKEEASNILVEVLSGHER